MLGRKKRDPLTLNHVPESNSLRDTRTRHCGSLSHPKLSHFTSTFSGGNLTNLPSSYNRGMLND